MMNYNPILVFYVINLLRRDLTKMQRETSAQAALYSECVGSIALDAGPKDSTRQVSVSTRELSFLA